MNAATLAQYRRLTNEALRKSGLSKLERARMLHDAAALAMPAACSGRPCESDTRECPGRHQQMSRYDRRDCLARLFAESNACKLEAQVAVGAGGAQGLRWALPKWIEAERAAAAAAASDQAPSRVAHAHFLAHWRSVTVAQLALFDGDFPAARKAFAEAREHAQHFGDGVSRAKELAAESIYVDAVAVVKAGLFEQAGKLFGQWLTLFPERRGVYDLRFDSIRANQLACVVLGNLLAGVDSVESLATLKRHLTTTNVPLPTWALYKRVQNIVAVAQLVPANVRPVIGEDGSLWTLFLTRTTLDESDKSSGQARTFTPPRLLDMSYLTSDHQRWQEILEQNVKNALLVLAEYERFRYEQPFEDEEHLPALTRVPTIGDTASAEDLLRLVRVYLERRDQRLVPQCDRARALVTEFAHTISAQRFAEASEIHQQILKSFRFPHTSCLSKIFRPCREITNPCRQSRNSM